LLTSPSCHFEVLSFSTRWVRILIKRYNEGGPSQLGDQHADNVLRREVSHLERQQISLR
jgi:hypothetical protein